MNNDFTTRKQNKIQINMQEVTKDLSVNEPSSYLYNEKRKQKQFLSSISQN